MNGSGKTLKGARFVAYTALAAASLTAGKFVLSAIPNVEIVTLLCAVYGFVLGAQGVLATCIFVACETLIYGLGPWVISYAIHWPAVALVFWLLSRFIKPSRVIPTIVAVIMTTSFGVLTALVDVGLFSGFWDDFGQRFAIYYARGAVFYVTQIVCNALVFPLLFRRCFRSPRSGILRLRSGIHTEQHGFRHPSDARGTRHPRLRLQGNASERRRKRTQCHGGHSSFQRDQHPDLPFRRIFLPFRNRTSQNLQKKDLIFRRRSLLVTGLNLRRKKTEEKKTPPGRRSCRTVSIDIAGTWGHCIAERLCAEFPGAAERND